jgi:adenylosuccinate lyase
MNSGPESPGGRIRVVTDGRNDNAAQDVPNVLASRYASTDLRSLWSPTGRIVSERQFWVAVLQAQTDLGVLVPKGVIEAYQNVIQTVDLASIRDRERVTRHDVKARIEEFCALAGHEHIHKGLTSRDLTENVEQMMVRRSLTLIRDKAIAALSRLAALAVEHRDTVLTGRSHNVAAQPTTLGKRFANTAQELLIAVRRIEDLIVRYPLRGLKGPVGTQQDLLDLFDGDSAKVDELERRIATALGFETTLVAVGQVYPRSLDLDVVSALLQIVSGPSSLATTLRLMAAHDLVTEGFRQGQVGSTAMPHKMNMRTSERVNGLAVILSGYVTMATALAGHQWNEGDVSDSVVRRVMLPDAFFAADGLFEAFLTVLDEFGGFTGRIEAELQAELPFLTTTKLLIAAVKAGMGRESAHELIKTHTLEAAAARRDGREYDAWDALGNDPDFPLDHDEIKSAVGDPSALTGRAGDQVDAIVADVGKLAAQYPDAATYSPEALL